MSTKDEPPKRTRRAYEVIVSLRLPLDATYKAIWNEGMDPDRLTESDIRRLQDYVKERPGRRQKPITSADVRGKSIAVLRNPSEKHDIYWLQGADDSPAEYYTMEQLFTAIKGRIPADSLQPEIVEKTTPRRSKKWCPWGSSGRPPGHTNYQALLPSGTFRFMVENADGLRRFLHVEDSGEVDISGNPVVQRKYFDDKVREAFAKEGYSLRAVMSPADLMGRMVKKMRGRIGAEMKRFLPTAEAAFLKEEFDVGRYNNHNHAKAVIKWLEGMTGERGGSRGLDFYARCLDKLYHGKFADERVGSSWIIAADNYEFTLDHAWAQSALPKRATADEFATAIARHYIERPDEYTPGEASRLFDGLYVMDRIEDVRDLSKARFQYGAPVNYLIINFEGIDAIANGVVERIRKGDLQPDRRAKKNKPAYRGIKSGKLKLTDENIHDVKVVMDRQLLKPEQEAFDSMKVYEEDIKPAYRQKVWYFYLKAKGDKALGYRK